MCEYLQGARRAGLWQAASFSPARMQNRRLTTYLAAHPPRVQRWGIHSAASASPRTVFAVPRWPHCPFPIDRNGVPVRQFILRLRTCEAGAGTIEYALLIAVLALGLVGVLGVFRNTVGGMTNRTAVTVTKAAGGYGRAGSVGVGRGGGSGAHKPAPAGTDSSAAQPDGSPATGGSTVASSNPATP
jgi:Flp pilus assembly pilin Flp